MNPIIAIVRQFCSSLYHGCTPPAELTINTVTELHAAMVTAAREYNRGNSPLLPAAQPWAYDGVAISHTTTSGRMRISATDRKLSVGLFSPSYEKGEIAYFTFSYAADGEAIGRFDWERPLGFWEEFIPGSRQSAIETIKLVVGEEAWARGVDPETREVIKWAGVRRQYIAA